jgi:ElaB/YqjD/DUF883 family membrane-anchored ribosome-binding protein
MSNAQIADNVTNDVEETAIAKAAKNASETLKNYAVTVDDYVHDSPWLAIGTAAAAAAALGFLAGTLLASNRRRWI